MLEEERTRHDGAVQENSITALIWQLCRIAFLHCQHCTWFDPFPVFCFSSLDLLASFFS